ncbi:MAG: sensor histidine kinase [Salibacteraceae bacterium]
MKINRTFITVFLVAGLTPPLFINIPEWVEAGYMPTAAEWQTLGMKMIIGSIITLTISLTVFQIVSWLQRKYPWEENITRRAILEIVCTYPVAVGMILLLGLPMYFLAPYEEGLEAFCASNITITILMNTVLLAFSEGVYYFKLWKKSLLRNEQLEKENLRSQLESLRTQVNPHFLFNSLSVLSSLIYSDQAKAEQFVDEFARVYRYVLDIREKTVVTLREELDFIHSYLFLQQIRFGENLKVDIQIDEERLNDFVPPLSLQLLLENAIKHNTVSRDTPLVVALYNEGEKLVVRNNLQPRDEKVPSTGLGLQNLKERYRLFADSIPEFVATDSFYFARLPLIKAEL